MSDKIIWHINVQILTTLGSLSGADPRGTTGQLPPPRMRVRAGGSADDSVGGSGSPRACSSASPWVCSSASPRVCGSVGVWLRMRNSGHSAGEWAGGWEGVVAGWLGVWVLLANQGAGKHGSREITSSPGARPASLQFCPLCDCVQDTKKEDG